MIDYKTLISASCLLLISSVGLADKQIKSGQYKAAVVELYTSEGCSSCPPADRFLSGLGETEQADQIIPMAFHVDYWNYIGWNDPFSKAQYTERQRGVARVNKQSSIYTPEFVVDGVESRGASQITRKIQAALQAKAEADITLNVADIDTDQLLATVTVDEIQYQGSDTPVIYMAIVENDLSNNIDAGENNGLTLEHNYVVRHLSEQQETNNGKTHKFDVALDPDWNRSAIGVSVVVRLRDSGRTLQAVKIQL